MAVVGSLSADDNITCVDTTAQQSAARAYWTDRKKEQARPFELPAIEATPSLVRALDSYGKYLLASAYLGSVGNVDVADASQAPFNAVGKLFFANSVGATDYCTASFVHNDVLLTAAHCVRPSLFNFFNVFLFTRAFGDPNHEDFDIAAVATFDEWVTKPDPERNQYDFACVATATHLANVSPLRFDFSLPPTWLAVAYPKRMINGAGNGKDMMYAIGSGAFNSKYGMFQMDYNPLGKGSSGGSWIHLDENGDPTETVFSVASELGPVSNSLLGPVLDQRVITLCDRVQKRCR